ncbi:MAG: tryptophan 7-halogenase [Acidimicrobiales bacterium]
MGGGIGGLAVGLFLAPRGHEVTILDADPMAPPGDAEEAWSRWPRPGVAQLRNIHLFNARGRNVLRDRAPHVLAALRAAGAGEIHLGGPDDDELVRLTCRRTTYEWVLRRAVRDAGRARVIGSARVVALLGDERRVTGVRTEAGNELGADLVVDASGRRSPLPTWLAALGARPPRRDEVANGTVSYTRWYRLRSEAGAALVRADLGYAVAVVAPADDGMFCVTFGCLGGDQATQPLRHEAAFDAAAAAVAPVAAWTDPGRAAAQGPVLFMADRANRFTRMTEQGTPVAAGVVALADSAMCTNPGYGRGVGLALVHATALAAVLDEVADAADAPQLAARAFAEATARDLEPWYHAATEADRIRLVIGRRLVAGEAWDAVGAPGDDPAVRFARGAPHAVAHDPVVARASHRAFQLLDPPTSYWGNPDIAARVEEVWRAIDRAPPPSPGPDHRAMGRLLASAARRR